MNSIQLLKTQNRSSNCVLQSASMAYMAEQPLLRKITEGFTPVSLEQMDRVALLDRVDTKFILSTAQLLAALQNVQPSYSILSIDGKRLNHYRTLYYDTPDFAYYHDHVNGRSVRYKVRSREYTDSSLSFLEVKQKNRKDRTVKQRLPSSHPVLRLTPPMYEWLREVYPVGNDRLVPVLWNTFTRITLVSNLADERVTLDVDVAFQAQEKTVRLDGLAIAEVKTNIHNSHSCFIEQMRAQKNHPQGFSKYTIGVAMLYDRVKKNMLKPKMLWLERNLKGISYNE